MKIATRWWWMLLVLGLGLPALGLPALARPQARPPAQAAAATIDGVVREASGVGKPLVVEAPNQTQQLNLRGRGIAVVRNGLPARLLDLRPGDAVSLHIAPDNTVQRVEARGAAGVVPAGVSVVVGTVERNTGGQLLLMTARSIDPQPFAIPEDAAILRQGRPTQLAAIQTDDSAVVVLDDAGQIRALFAQPDGNHYVVEGTTTGRRDRQNRLEVQVAEQVLYVPLEGGDIRRNGEPAEGTDIREGDQITVRFDPLSRPDTIVLQSTERQSLLERYGWAIALLFLILLILLFPLLLGQQRTERRFRIPPGRYRRIRTP